MGRGFWLFGYGSLVWRPDFPFEERVGGCVQGFARRFWQGSTDHRGVPGAPGRVVTLTHDPEAICWGVGYRVGDGVAERVLSQLDHREKGGYERLSVTLNLIDGRCVPALAYRATPDNPNYLGPAPLAEIAATVRVSSGPSGPNDEYVLRLADALRALGVDDPHLTALAALVRG